MERQNKRKVGSAYEDLAVKYLEENGYRILERNYRIRQGEIDIIAKEENRIVFVEVKYRKDASAGFPAEAVTKAKQRIIYMVAKQYLYSKRYPENTPVRFDVIAILGETVTHIRDAFQD